MNKWRCCKELWTVIAKDLLSEKQLIWQKEQNPNQLYPWKKDGEIGLSVRNKLKMQLTITLRQAHSKRQLKLLFLQDNGAKQSNFYKDKLLKYQDLSSNKLLSIMQKLGNRIWLKNIL